MIDRLTTAELAKILAGKKTEEKARVVKFYSEKCYLCRNLRPHYYQIAKNNEDLEFYVFDVADYPQIQRRLNFKGVPTIVLIRSGGDFGKTRVTTIGDPDVSDPSTYYTRRYIQDFIEECRER